MPRSGPCPAAPPMHIDGSSERTSGASQLERLRKRSVLTQVPDGRPPAGFSPVGCSAPRPVDPAGHAKIFEVAVSRFEEGASTIDVPGATPEYVHQGLVEVGDGAQRRRVLLCST